jgi:hypothetical protein
MGAFTFGSRRHFQFRSHCRTSLSFIQHFFISIQVAWGALCREDGVVTTAKAAHEYKAEA